MADSTLTLRLTREDRALLDELVVRRLEQTHRDGTQITAASYVRGLIRREALALGLLDPGVARPRAPSTPPHSERDGPPPDGHAEE